ncbi:YAK1 [Blepharisma stoltei]|uniref:Protein kinase domain-containing protein n=1 Tax=Blepharisma stoltei TaxID=1481888 RepID=A0AAU9IQF0_9CILI|nr:unnamed protein product [Blepharisma stoltei]
MASLVKMKNFKLWSQPFSDDEDEKRPDSPTVLITNANIAPAILKLTTISLLKIYRICNPNYSYDPSENPTRPLTKPNEPKFNNGYDNEHYNYILYVNQILTSPENEQYIILDSLGEGTFGQVVKVRKRNGELFAAKVIKNKPAYFIQGLIEVKILSKLNRNLDPHDQNHIVRMIDYFVFRNHLVIIFELLSLNIYELIKKNDMRGFSLSLIRSFTKQILEAFCVLEKGNIIHCDLKPENVLLVNDSVNVKVIDFGSACFEDATIYTYIQSRYYRSPEVLVGVPYGSEIDTWSLGCICAELFIGIPLFPGANEYEQLYRIIQLLGPLEQSFINEGKFRDKLFILENGEYRLKAREEFMKTQGVQLQPYRVFTNLSSLDDLLYLDRRIPNEENDIENRKPFVHFLKGLLILDPTKRWSAHQAIMHPFIRGGNCESFMPPSKIHREYRAPVGALRGSCPSLLERIRNSQDMTEKSENACYRPCVEELQDNFFTGFAHGKLVQVSSPPQNPPIIEASKMQFQPVQNPFANMPMNFNPNQFSQPFNAPPGFLPLPDIRGPRYMRPHSYGPGGAYQTIPRPYSPKLEDGKAKNKKKKYSNKMKYDSQRSSSYTAKDHHKPKVRKQEPRPSSIEDGKMNSPKHDKFPTLTKFDERQIPPINSVFTPKNVGLPVIPEIGYLEKIKKEAKDIGKAN